MLDENKSYIILEVAIREINIQNRKALVTLNEILENKYKSQQNADMHHHYNNHHSLQLYNVGNKSDIKATLEFYRKGLIETKCCNLKRTQGLK